MQDLQKEKDFFHDITKSVVALVAERAKDAAVAEDKGGGDYSTQIDIDVERLIVDTIQKAFPGDAVLAEEAHSEAVIPDGRIWIIDPICGTLNLGKGINNFCTNIALADNQELIAACVIDHSTNDCIWSIGNNEVYVNDALCPPVSPDLGVNIDIDFGSIRNASEEIQRKHHILLKKLLETTEFNLLSMNTSLGLAYCATGKIDGFVLSFNHPWDVCAGNFLLQQAGGVTTALDGSPWTLTTVGQISARTPELHKQLLSTFNNTLPHS